MTTARAAGARIAAALRRFWRVTILFPSVLASGCSPAQLVNALVSHDDFELITDRPYGTLARQKLDITRRSHPIARNPSSSSSTVAIGKRERKATTFLSARR